MKTHRCVLFGQYILSVIILYSYQMSCSEVPAEKLNKNVLPPIVLAVKGEWVEEKSLTKGFLFFKPQSLALPSHPYGSSTTSSFTFTPPCNFFWIVNEQKSSRLKYPKLMSLFHYLNWDWSNITKSGEVKMTTNKQTTIQHNWGGHSPTAGFTQLCDRCTN